MTEESSEVPGELIGKSRAVVDFPFAAAPPSPPPPFPPLPSRTSCRVPAPLGSEWSRTGSLGGAGKFAPIQPPEKPSPERAGVGRNGEPRERTPRVGSEPPGASSRRNLRGWGGLGWRKKGAGCWVWGVLEASRILYCAQPSAPNSGSLGTRRTGRLASAQ